MLIRVDKIRIYLIYGLLALIWAISLSPETEVHAKHQQIPSISIQDTDFLSDSVYFWSLEGIQRIDPDTLETTLFYEYQPPANGYFIDIDLDLVGQKLYVVEVIGSPVRAPDSLNKPANLVQINLVNNERIIVWEGTNIDSVDMSPSSNRLLIRYRGLINDMRDRPEISYCVLFLIDGGECHDIGINFVYVQWFDEQTILYAPLSSNQIVFIDAQTLERRTEFLSGWTFSDIDTSHNGRSLFSLVFGDGFDGMGSYFSMIDLDSLKVTTISHRPLYQPIWRMGLSPDETYFFYARSETYVIVNIETEIYHEISIPSQGGEVWLPNSEGLITISRRFDEEVQQDTLIYIDVDTGTTEIIGDYPIMPFRPTYFIN